MRSIPALAILAGAFIVAGQTADQNWAHRIVSLTRRPLASFINPHISPVNVLIIDGKRFEHVRGLKTFYLRVPNAPSIVFIVDEADHSVTYHIFNMDTGEDAVVRARSSAFGESIGSDRLCDSVSVGDDGTIVLSTLCEQAQSTLPQLSNVKTLKISYYLHLKKKTVTRKRAIYYDEAGKSILERDTVPAPVF